MLKTKKIEKTVDFGGMSVRFDANPWDASQRKYIPAPEVLMSISHPKGILIQKSDIRKLIRALESVEKSLTPQ